MRTPAQKTILIALMMIATATAIVIALMLRNRPQTFDAAATQLPEGEPQSYSATVIRTIDDGSVRREIAARVVRSGEMRREDWEEQGARRALILRPDLGKSFLLAIDDQEYVEMDLAPVEAATRQSAAADIETIERALNDAPSPAGVEVHTLPDQIIDNHLCNVIESRATFADGHVEITRTFRARNLSGLDIRVESQSTASDTKMITERRDIKTEVSGEEFNVPAGFKRVTKLRGD